MHIIITGASHGIGLALAQAYEGHHLYTVDKDPGCWQQLDLSQTDQVQRFIEAIKQETDTIDLFIHNAPAAMVGIHEGCPDQFNQALQVGLVAPYTIIQACLPLFSENSNIILMTSTRAHQSQKETESYSATKGGLLSLTHSLANSLAPKTRVNAISPGWINTSHAPLSQLDHSQQLVGRVGTEEDIVHAVQFLASKKASFITGQELVIDGGMSKRMIYHGDEGWSFSI